MSTSIPHEHQKYMELAVKYTTPLITYRPDGNSGTPIGRGTGFFLQHGRRAFVITNTHVLEKKYAAGGVHVQVWSGEGESGSELHAGYLITPNDRMTTVLGVSSPYAHRDVGIIELTHAAADLARGTKRFMELDDLELNLPTVGETVFYKGYPAKSAEFHAPIRKSLFGWWLDVRTVAQVDPQLIVTGGPTAVYRSPSFTDEDGKDLHGISGSALFSGKNRRIIGVVWGGYDGTVNSAVYAVPARVVHDLVMKYEKHQPETPGKQATADRPAFRARGRAARR